jgi:uncharacterized protein (DUF1810 family)
LGDDPFDLQRFVTAQEPVFSRVREELISGQKTSHWMWFIFPQITGLSQSSKSRRFAILSTAEALAYMAHPVLGQRLIDCTQAVNVHEEKSVAEIFGFPDDVKFHACVTLFGRTSGHKVFKAALSCFFDGAEHEFTVRHTMRQHD